MYGIDFDPDFLELLSESNFPVASGAIFFSYMKGWPITFALAYAKHQLFLQDIEEIEEEDRPRGECLDYEKLDIDQGTILSLLDLTDINLRNDQLIDADFSGCDLTCSDLSFSRLYDSNLKEVCAVRINLIHVEAGNAIFENGNLSNAQLESAFLAGANLKKAYLRSAKMERSDLEEANLEGADLEEAYLRNAKLQGANLKCANLKGAYLKCADFKGANLQGANFEGTDLDGANFEGANLQDANFKGADLDGANFLSSNVEDGSFGEAKCRDKAQMDNAQKLSTM
ncbi:pentapeptide repeat-containing protein [Lamprobacter modestohalophilus]|uniref:pentapeptide repeat-containing protein n=1 Tax=Lamprobacter modestohalophilus TaxID=1064514 RepID=UPI002ADEB460|nr:pentapeptide repeat-containing protein [Lamprobacter modestohalophilus]MEA1048378.1 pentapeptide repeat-containing protein [Lamprobacter modestohalophilus]